MKPSKMVHKTLVFYTNLCNVYKDEEEREETAKLEMERSLTEDMTALLMAAYVLFRRLAGSEEDLIGFTHIPEPSCSPVLRGEERKRWQRE